MYLHTTSKQCKCHWLSCSAQPGTATGRSRAPRDCSSALISSSDWGSWNFAVRRLAVSNADNIQKELDFAPRKVKRCAENIAVTAHLYAVAQRARRTAIF